MVERGQMWWKGKGTEGGVVQGVDCTFYMIVINWCSSTEFGSQADLVHDSFLL